MFVEEKNKILTSSSEVVITDNQNAYLLNLTTLVKHIVRPDKQFIIMEVYNSGDVGLLYGKFLNGKHDFGVWFRNILIDLHTNESDSSKYIYHNCKIINMVSIENVGSVSSVRIVMRIV